MKGDAFAQLGMPRRAMLDPDEIRAAFQKRGAKAHPDGAAGSDEAAGRTAAFAELNESRAVLTSIPKRLRHLLELEYPGTAAASAAGAPLDGAMMDLFAAAGAAIGAAQGISQRRARAATALARAMLAGDEMKAREDLEAAIETVTTGMDGLAAELEEIDHVRAAGGDARVRLQTAAAKAGFLEKWQAKLREAYAGLMIP